MSRTRHASASREKQGSSSFTGQVPLYIKAEVEVIDPMLSSIITVHLSIGKGKWQSVGMLPVSIEAVRSHVADASVEQSAAEKYSILIVVPSQFILAPWVPAFWHVFPNMPSVMGTQTPTSEQSAVWWVHCSTAPRAENARAESMIAVL